MAEGQDTTIDLSLIEAGLQVVLHERDAMAAIDAGQTTAGALATTAAATQVAAA